MIYFILLFLILPSLLFFLLYYKEKKEKDDLYDLVIAMLSVRYNNDELFKTLLYKYQEKWGKK